MGRRCRHSGPTTTIGYRTVVIVPSLCGDMMYSFAVEPHRAEGFAGWLYFLHSWIGRRPDGRDVWAKAQTPRKVRAPQGRLPGNAWAHAA